MANAQFSQSNPRTLAIHVVWTTYMSWLPGDKRGHRSPLMDFYGRLIARGHQLNIADEITRLAATAIARGTARHLEPADTLLAADTIGQVIPGGLEVGMADGKPASRWTIYAAAIEREHLHLLLAANTEDVSKLVGRVKGKSSRTINHANGCTGKTLWTAGFWRVFLFDWDAVRAARNYIVNHNVRRNIPVDPFPWITPPPI